MKCLVLLHEEKIFCTLLYSHISAPVTPNILFLHHKLGSQLPSIHCEQCDELPAFHLLMFLLPAVPLNFIDDTHEGVNMP